MYVFLRSKHFQINCKSDSGDTINNWYMAITAGEVIYNIQWFDQPFRGNLHISTNKQKRRNDNSEKCENSVSLSKWDKKNKQTYR